MRKGLVTFCTDKDAFTVVTDHVSATIPDQSLTLRELLMQFAYVGEEKLNEIVNRGFGDDDDDDALGVDVGALDYAEVHDRLLYLVNKERDARSIHYQKPAPVEDPAPVDEVEEEKE